MLVSISNARTGETLGPGNASAHFGLEHFAIESEDIEADIARLATLGARLQEGPTLAPNGVRFAFLEAPDEVRIELVQPPR
jgi:catechol 2,3-dioxygenase-like lactoylglutathione lyase family enzyme